MMNTIAALNSFVAPMTAVLCIAFTVIFYRKKITDSMDEYKAKISDDIEISKKSIEESISPRVVFNTSIELVRNEVASLIEKAAFDFEQVVAHNNKEISKGSSDRIDVSEYFMTIYGAASLFNESEAGNALDDKARQNSIEQYKNALEASTKSRLQFRRYLALIPANELESRSLSIREEYYEWLKTQLNQLERDANYTLIICQRAPQWGTSNTTFITNTGLVEVKGHGRSAFAVHDNRIAATLRESLRKDIYSALPQNRVEINSAIHETLEMFAQLVEDAKPKLKKKPNSKKKPSVKS